MANADAIIERQQIEAVFGLTGGELADDRWDVGDQTGTARAYAYWYEGPPEWAAHEFTDRYDVDYRTLICCCLFGGPPEVLGDDEGAWSRVASYASSGETECPWRGAANCAAEGPCALCGGDEEDHGHVYLGDGWCEVVYRRNETA